jgi:hypothetical protein
MLVCLAKEMLLLWKLENLVRINVYITVSDLRSTKSKASILQPNTYHLCFYYVRKRKLRVVFGDFIYKHDDGTYTG